jgi:ubiquinone/menaquinone biosynthesis C-methylase UbiE
MIFVSAMVDRQIEYYAGRAAEYERIYDKPGRQEELSRIKQWVGGSLHGRHVLEVACGTGYWTAIAAATASSIVAMDANEAVLQIARAKRLPPERVTFLQGDAYEFHSLPGRFDAALIGFWWSHVPLSRQALFLAQLQRVLLPGALVLMFDNTWVSGESTPISRTDEEGNTYQERRLDDGRVFEIIKNHPSQQTLQATLGSVGQGFDFAASRHYWQLKCYWIGEAALGGEGQRLS